VQVKVKVPLIGRQLEGQVRGYLETLVAREQEYLAQWIAEPPASA
jgi:hypothetical protein